MALVSLTNTASLFHSFGVVKSFMMFKHGCVSTCGQKCCPFFCACISTPSLKVQDPDWVSPRRWQTLTLHYPHADLLDVCVSWWFSLNKQRWYGWVLNLNIFSKWAEMFFSTISSSHSAASRWWKHLTAGPWAPGRPGTPMSPCMPRGPGWPCLPSFPCCPRPPSGPLFPVSPGGPVCNPQQQIHTKMFRIQQIESVL